MKKIDHVTEEKKSRHLKSRLPNRFYVSVFVYNVNIMKTILYNKNIHVIKIF